MIPGCLTPSNVSPNNNLAADSIVTSIAHEIFDIVSDAYGAWKWSKNAGSMNYGLETGDLCSYFIGYNLSALYTVIVGNKRWYTQGNIQ